MLVALLPWLFSVVAALGRDLASCNDEDEGYFVSEVDFLNQQNPKDYVFEPLKGINGDNPVNTINAASNPALARRFFTAVGFHYEPCAMNLPHTHPRADEISMVTKGKLLMGFVSENGGPDPVEYELKEGQVMVFPRGSVHYQLNSYCEEAEMYAVLNHHDAGTLSLPGPRLHMIKSEALAAAYNVTPDVWDWINDFSPDASPAEGSPKCMYECYG